MIMRLKDEVAIVTGAAQGIGESIARTLAGQGASVVIGDIKSEGAEKVAEDIRKSGAKALAAKVDISKEDEVRQMVQKTIDEFGRVDILVNNAAFVEMPLKLFHERDSTEWKVEIDTTLVGTLLCCRAVVPHMMKQKSGRIISVTSIAGKVAQPRASVYSACKAGVAGFSRALARELATEGITVNCVSPGPVRTPATARLAQDPEIEKAWVALIPMGRMGEPQDIANMVAFLASDDAKFITGQDYSVDGGQTL